MRIALLSFIFFAVTSLIPTGVLADNQAGNRTILEGLTFDQGSFVLKKTVIPSLQPLLEELQSDPSLRISIESHANATGEPDKDLRLTRQRSQIIFNWLVAQGVEAGRISPLGFGSTRPLVEKEPKEGAAKNNRIEIVKTRQGFPVAEFPSTGFQFEPVVDGMDVRHEYVVRNTGTAELLIKEVKTG
jgi:hypothetical protein